MVPHSQVSNVDLKSQPKDKETTKRNNVHAENKITEKNSNNQKRTLTDINYQKRTLTNINYQKRTLTTDLKKTMKTE